MRLASLWPSVAALAAIQPSKLKKNTITKLDELNKLSKGIKQESAVWFNAFVGRIYRDASRSHKFLNDYSRLISTKLNKAKRPKVRASGENEQCAQANISRSAQYISEFMVSGLKLGDVPPIIKNAKWVLPNVLHGFDLENDAAVDMDVVYRAGRGEEDLGGIGE